MCEVIGDWASLAPVSSTKGENPFRWTREEQQEYSKVFFWITQVLF